MTARACDIADLSGLWQRSLIQHPDGTRDTTTWVAWLQGPSLFVDLRVPSGRPSFEGVSCQQDLTADHVAWLARQEGFAGRLVREGEAFVWHRMLDFQPPSALADAGCLSLIAAQDAAVSDANLDPQWDGDALIEVGRDVSYVEHWHRAAGPQAAAGAMRLSDPTSACEGFLVRSGAQFMYARSRPGGALEPGRSLCDTVRAAPSLRAAQDLLDCEISFGCICAVGWMIARSSLPHREGARLEFETAERSHGRLGLLIRQNGVICDARQWSITECEGKLEL